ncbi:MAG: lipid-A-disaccharide synthase [Candidatus Omnitrophota bacterium]|jgi:lipid-A-disaccharide synthase
MKKNILIIAGEPSGDIRAGELIKELKKFLPEVHFWGIGGDRMEAEGVELIKHVRHFSIIGVWEAIKKLPQIHRQFKDVVKNARERKPFLAVLVDYPGFNLKLAAFLHGEKIPVIYYIIPQIWAWGGGRIKLLKRYLDKALVLFGFEEKLLKSFGINCEFVGHPLLDSMPERETRDSSSGSLIIALLPGSRKTEIASMFPLMLDAAEMILKKRKNVNFVVAENSNIDKALYDAALAGHSSLRVKRVKDKTFDCLNECDFAIVTSGTATLETAVMEKPMVISYRTSALTAALFRLFAKTTRIGLVNIIAGKEIAPEILQEDATPENLSQKVLEIINDENRMRDIKQELKKVKECLGGEGASRKAAAAVYEFIKTRGLLA